MKKPTLLRSGAVLAAISGLSTAAHAQTLFSSSMDTAEGWSVNASHLGSAATFGFNYSSIGIPAAPNSGGTTVGLKLEANVPGGDAIFQAISVSPTGGVFNGDFQLRFDLWQNFPGNYPGGGTGSTQLTGAGIGTSGSSALWPGNAANNGVLFMTTGDGALTTGDYRIYPSAAQAAPSSGMYAAGTTTSPDVRDSAHPYYASFGGVSGPAEQGYTGTTGIGTQGMEWHDVAITRIGNTVTWEIDGILIGTVDAGSLTLSGNNFALVQSDINNGTTTVAQRPHLFGLFDNVRVTVVPEPSAAALMAIAGAAFLARRRKS